ncbi:hypothetical protein A9K55_000291 [Cordyceps militaris]|uniref:Uncharacterized protein n=1 Tax=Cordyceps militaris TaxID=73501 RepID=A0A2H4SVU2_CORMI|nr:hypothetical protein A9K55_000291 [Cordyceps militaris]
MALFPLEIDEPRPCPRGTHSNPLLLAGGLAMSLVYTWGPFAALALRSDDDDGFLPSLAALASLILLLVFLLQAFLVYRLLSTLRALPPLTDPVDAFFYESRAGSALLLLGLCVPWCVMGVYGLVLALPAAVDAFAHPPGAEDAYGRAVQLLLSLIMVTTPLALAAGVWWAARTAGRAAYRVLGVGYNRHGRYESVPLGWEESGPQERGFRKSMRGKLFGAVPTASWLPW